MGGQFWSVYVPAALDGKDAVRVTLEQIDVVYGLVRRYPETLRACPHGGRIEPAFAGGASRSLIGMEGGHSIDNSLAALRMFYGPARGYMTLTHSANIRGPTPPPTSLRTGGFTVRRGGGRGR